METLTTLDRIDLHGSNNMYKIDDFHEFSTLNLKDLNNKLFCTFTQLEDLDDLLNSITKKYKILYNKIFVLYIKSQDEYVCTYNIDQVNVTGISSFIQLDVSTGGLDVDGETQLDELVVAGVSTFALL